MTLQATSEKFDWRKADAEKHCKNLTAVRKTYAKRTNNEQRYARLLESVEGYLSALKLGSSAAAVAFEEMKSEAMLSRKYSFPK